MDWWNHFDLIRFLDANQGLCDVYRSALQRCGGWNPTDAWDLCGFLTIHNCQFWSLGRGMNEYEWHARVCLGSVYSSVGWLIYRKKKSHWQVVALAGSEVVLCPMIPLVRQFAPNSGHTMRILDRPCWGSCWTEVTSDQLERIRAKSLVLGKNVLGSKFGLCCLKKWFPYKICDMIPVRYPGKGRMAIKWSLLVYYEVLQHVHHVISCHLFKLSRFTTVYLTIFRKVLCWLGHLASLHCFLSCAWLKLQLPRFSNRIWMRIALVAFVDLELLLSAMLHTSLSICRFRFSISTILLSMSHDVTPWDLSACNARYDHIRFAAEALKLRDKVWVVRVPDILGEPQDKWIWWMQIWKKVWAWDPFHFSCWWISKHMTHKWLIFIYVMYSPFPFLNAWIRFVYAMIELVNVGFVCLFCAWNDLH